MIFDDIAGEHDVLIGHMDDNIARRMRAAQLHQVHPAIAKENRHAARETGGGPCQAGDAVMPLKQAREALELAVPIFLPALCHHTARGIRHQDLPRAIGRGAQHPAPRGNASAPDG